MQLNPAVVLNLDNFKQANGLDKLQSKPEVDNVALLPVSGNTLGDLRAAIDEQLWFVWDGAAWQNMGSGVAYAVTKVGFGASADFVEVSATNPLPVAATLAIPVPLPVTGPLTDAQLRATAVPVSGPLTDAQLRASVVPVAPNITRGQGNVDANTTRVTISNDGPLMASIGAPADTPATTDTGTFNIIQFIKRGLQNWTTLLARVPAQNITGLLPVDVLGTPGTPRVQATSGTAASIVLTTTCRRVSMFATTGTWYSISGTATATSHYIGAGERLDFDVPASTTISVLQETAAGSIRITELT